MSILELYHRVFKTNRSQRKTVYRTLGIEPLEPRCVLALDGFVWSGVEGGAFGDISSWTAPPWAQDRVPSNGDRASFNHYAYVTVDDFYSFDSLVVNTTGEQLTLFGSSASGIYANGLTGISETSIESGSLVLKSSGNDTSRFLLNTGSITTGEDTFLELDSAIAEYWNAMINGDIDVGPGSKFQSSSGGSFFLRGTLNVTGSNDVPWNSQDGNQSIVSATNLFIGIAPAGDGKAQVSNHGRLWAENLTVGSGIFKDDSLINDSVGEVQLTDHSGISVEVGMVIGKLARGAVTLNQSSIVLGTLDSLTNVALVVGSSGNGEVVLNDHSNISGFRANNATIDIGKIGGIGTTTGKVTLSNHSTIQDISAINVGGAGVGELDVLSSSTVELGSLTSGITVNGPGAGVVHVGGGTTVSINSSATFRSFSLLIVDAGGTISSAGGFDLLDDVFNGPVAGGEANAREGYTLGELPILAGGGTIVGNVSGSGQIIPGRDGVIDKLSIAGDLVEGASSVTLIDLHGQFSDSIDVCGAVRLNGELKVTNLGGALFESQYFDIVTGEILGDFTNLTSGNIYDGGTHGLPNLDAGLQWQVSIEGGTTYRLTVVAKEPPKISFMGFDQFEHDVEYIIDIPDHDDEVTYTFTVYGGTAHLGQHFDVHHPAAANVGDTATGTLTFASHQTRDFIILSIKDFNLYETGAPDTRSFSIDLVDDYGDLVFAGNGAIRSFYYSLSFDGTTPDNDESFDEGDSDAKAYVMISATPFEGVLADFRTIEQTATAGRDYQAVSSTANFAAGSMTAQEVKLNILDDYLYERVPEQFQAKITNLMAGTFLPGYGLATVKIRDNEQVPTVVIADKEVTVGGTLQFRAYLSNASAEAISISYQTQDGSAQDGLDYDGVNGTLYFAPEYTSADVEKIDTHADYQSGTKTFYLTLSTAAGADEVKLPDVDPLGTILDGQEWVDGFWTGNYEYQNLGHMVSRWVGTHWVEDYYVAGHWDGGNWVEGILTGGDWIDGHYEGGTWVDGHNEGSDWVDAHYEGGTFIGGHYDGGTFVSGHYENGDWIDGAMFNDQWVDAHYEGGSFLPGHMEGQQLVPGHMEGQQFVAGHMENQILIPGHNVTPWIAAVYDENGDLVTEGHDGDPDWVDEEWVGGNWVDDALVGGTWVDDAWTGGSWVDDQWIDRTWVDGYYALQQWIDAHFQQLWIDDHWEGQFWVDDHWENQSWIDGYYAVQNWIDAHWENQNWVSGNWINQTWTDAHWENQTWVDAYTAGHWADDYVDEWVDDWQNIWVDRYVEGHWITT